MLQNALPLQELHHVLLSHYHYDHCSDAGALSYGRLHSNHCIFMGCRSNRILNV